ncbi:hypothetical protein H1O16_gp178 [Burkholderia phage BcepSaruman]|uniref:Uncharacterized protein n=1 Tax=Burkholderia phage BcepSaruman TaxID=2530032 RepID=A0A4D5ZCQ2_9CAUD|nr:hypothetical protein H1O16_gp178 [Burkholderia phage BcepSaruman]QBX06591.1 hypothetical protein BcepSaruman_178 [Burkholderia phage BcepSaruman]
MSYTYKHVHDDGLEVFTSSTQVLHTHLDAVDYQYRHPNLEKRFDRLVDVVATLADHLNVDLIKLLDIKTDLVYAGKPADNELYI